MDIGVRRGTVNDAQGVIEVINSVIQEGGLTSIYPPLTLEQEEAYIAGLDARGALFVAEMSGAILGVHVVEPFARYTRAMDHVATMGTFVYRNFRRRGVGSKLIATGFDFARAQGYEKALIFVRAGNGAAQAFYRQAGFIPKMLLEAQVKVGNKYDDEILMEMFIPQPEVPAIAEARPEAAGVLAEMKVVEKPALLTEEPPVAAPPVAVEPAKPEPEVAPVATAPAARAPTIPEAVPVAPAAAAPAILAAAPAVLAAAIDPIVGAVTVRRAKRQDMRTLSAILKGTMRWRTPPSEEEVLEMLFDKGYWLAMSRKGGGLSGWRAENLVMCIDDFAVYPPQYYPQLGGPLLETIETEAKALSCEVAIAFLHERSAPEAIQFFQSRGYGRQHLQELYHIWREVAQEFLTEGRLMMVKKLREKRIMRPI